MRYRSLGRFFLLSFSFCLLLVTGSANAWFFRSSDRDAEAEADGSEVKERQIASLSPQQGEVFVQLAQARSDRLEEIKVINRLTREKQLEMQTFDERLQNRFGIDPALSYTFDTTNKTVYVLEPERTGGDESETADPDAELLRRVEHRVLNAEEVEHFLQLLAAKRLTQQQLNLFALLLREKQLELNRVNQVMHDRFSVDPTRNYRFEAETRTLYERLDKDTSNSINDLSRTIKRTSWR